MKIFIVANPNIVHVRRWIRYFAQRHEVHLLAVKKPLTDLPREVYLHDLTRSTNARKLRFAIWPLIARRLISRLKPDLLHAHWISGAGWVAAATGFHPFMVTAHGSDLLVLPKHSIIHRELTRWVLDRADYVTCGSEQLLDKARQYGAPIDHSEFVGLGVNLTTFHPAIDVYEVRRELDLGLEPVIISIRAIQSIYNPLDIARAIPLVLEKVPNARFLIQSYNLDQDLLKTFEEIIAQAGVETAVKYVPFVEDETYLARYYQSADVAISLASSDGMPISVQEAMACGTAMVLGDIPAFHGWARHEEEALLVPLHDVESLSAAIVRLLKDQSLRSRLTKNSLAFIRAHSDSVKWMARSEKIYEKLVAHSRNGN